jgi:hypothetical protein
MSELQGRLVQYLAQLIAELEPGVEGRRPSVPAQVQASIAALDAAATGDGAPSTGCRRYSPGSTGMTKPFDDRGSGRRRGSSAQLFESLGGEPVPFSDPGVCHVAHSLA